MASPDEYPELVLEAGRASRHYWRDLWRYRELLGFLAWRDVKVRYKQTALGVLWALGLALGSLLAGLVLLSMRHLLTAEQDGRAQAPGTVGVEEVRG